MVEKIVRSLCFLIYAKRYITLVLTTNKLKVGNIKIRHRVMCNILFQKPNCLQFRPKLNEKLMLKTQIRLSIFVWQIHMVIVKLSEQFFTSSACSGQKRFTWITRQQSDRSLSRASIGFGFIQTTIVSLYMNIVNHYLTIQHVTTIDCLIPKYIWITHYFDVPPVNMLTECQLWCPQLWQI